MGDPAEALVLWGSIAGSNFVDHLEVAHAARRAGDLEQAEWSLRIATDWRMNAIATLELARLFDDTGRSEEALGQYRKLVRLWEAADPDLPQLLEAQSAIARLAG